jgi:dTDP-4-dehydrorhamnose reductase
MNTTLVFGASGQLGQCLTHVAQEKNMTGLVFPPEAQANILDPAGLRSLFEQHRPAYIINCAAYTAVDKAEDELDLARKVNRDGVENLARLCGEFSSTLIQISTDFVFAGSGNQPLTETDEAAPISVYGLTKLEGEQVIPALASQHFILRTSCGQLRENDAQAGPRALGTARYLGPVGYAHLRHRPGGVHSTHY